MESAKELLKKAYAYFNARNIDAILALMKPDVVWANGMDGGYVYGHDGVREYWTRQWEMIDPHVEPVSFEADDNESLVVNVYQVVHDLNKNLLVDQMVKHVYTIEDGFIKRMEIEKI
jgi:ketosteroid isomerase-like protein